MAILAVTSPFANGDQVPSSKLNSLVNDATFAAGAVADGTLSIDAGGGLKVGTIQTGNIASASITTAKIADSTGASDGITTAKLATGAVTTLKISDSNVTTAKIADSNVTTAKIADANITAAKLSGAQTGDAPVFGVRAWVLFDMTRNAAGGSDTANTTRYLIASGNVASVTKTATGAFTVAFTTALPDANFAYAGSAIDDEVAGDVIIGRPLGGTKTSSAIQLKCVAGGGSDKNYAEVSVMFLR